MSAPPAARRSSGPARPRFAVPALLGLALLLGLGLGLGLPRSGSQPARAAEPKGAPSEQTVPERAEPDPPAATPDGAPEAAPDDRAAVQRSQHELGSLLCADHDSYCGRIWREGMERGQPFNRLIAETCVWVFHVESDDAGIACAEMAIHAVPTLPDAVLVQGQFVPGERERHVYWRHQSDRQWAQVAAEYFQRIPNFCDQSTPVIYDYFPCLVREVQFFQTMLKNYQRFWPGPRRS